MLQSVLLLGIRVVPLPDGVFGGWEGVGLFAGKGIRKLLLLSERVIGICAWSICEHLWRIVGVWHSRMIRDGRVRCLFWDEGIRRDSMHALWIHIAWYKNKASKSIREN